MSKVTKLSENLAPALKDANEIWIAVAMITMHGVNFLTENIPSNCKVNLVVGVDLPTNPKALDKLIQLRSKLDLNIRIYTEENEFFHPKLYLVRGSHSQSVFIGSANFTNGGLNNNIEITIQIDDSINFNELKSWFTEIFNQAKPLTSSFVKIYKAKYSERRKQKTNDEKIARASKKLFNQEFETTLREKNAFLQVLRKYRNEPDYARKKTERATTVNNLRKTLDYPNFQRIDLDGFFKIWDLGHIIALPKPTLKREINKFSEVLKTLCDEKTDIAERYDNVLTGKLKIRGVNEGLISKVLTIHNPQDYYVKNSKSDKALKKYGVELPRGLTKGDKYKATCKFLKEICNDTNIENLAILDYYLYLEGESFN